MNLILCGLPGCGKTSVGKMAAQVLQWQFIDTDTLIEKEYAWQTGRSLACRQIYALEGEECFRQLEKKQMHSLIGQQKAVISVGGGSLDESENRKILQKLGALIYLKTSLDLLWKRISAGGIPLYLDQNDPEKAFYVLAERRMPIYEEAAEKVIEAGLLSKEEILQVLLSSWRKIDGE